VEVSKSKFFEDLVQSLGAIFHVFFDRLLRVDQITEIRMEDLPAIQFHGLSDRRFL